MFTTVKQQTGKSSIDCNMWNRILCGTVYFLRSSSASRQFRRVADREMKGSIYPIKWLDCLEIRQSARLHAINRYSVVAYNPIRVQLRTGVDSKNLISQDNKSSDFFLILIISMSGFLGRLGFQTHSYFYQSDCQRNWTSWFECHHQYQCYGFKRQHKDNIIQFCPDVLPLYILVRSYGTMYHLELS